MHRSGCEMPHRCVRRKCASKRFSASSLTDSLRSVVRLRRAESACSKTAIRLSTESGDKAERTCEQKRQRAKKAAPLAFFHRLRPLTSITKIDAQVRGGEPRQDYKDTRRFPWKLPRALSCSDPAAYRIPVRLSPFGKRGAFS